MASSDTVSRPDGYLFPFIYGRSDTSGYRDVIPPDGLVNVVTGGGTVGQELVKHPSVAAVSFTGSVEVGRQIATDAAAGFKKTVLELGGKSANIVYSDADLDAAIRGTLWGSSTTRARSAAPALASYCSAASRRRSSSGSWRRAER